MPRAGARPQGAAGHRNGTGCPRRRMRSGGRGRPSPAWSPAALRPHPVPPWGGGAAGVARHPVLRGSRDAGRHRARAVCPGSVPRPAEAVDSRGRRHGVRRAAGRGSAAGCRRGRRRNRNQTRCGRRSRRSGSRYEGRSRCSKIRSERQGRCPKTPCPHQGRCPAARYARRDRCPRTSRYGRRSPWAAVPCVSRPRRPTTTHRVGRRRPTMRNRSRRSRSLPSAAARQNPLRTVRARFPELRRTPRRPPKRGARPRHHRSSAHPNYPAYQACSAQPAGSRHPAHPARPKPDRTPKQTPTGTPNRAPMPNPNYPNCPSSRNAVGPSPRLLRRPTTARPPSSSGSWGVAVRGRAALPCSCTPRFLVPGPPFVRMRAGVLLPLLVYGPTSAPPSPGTHTNTKSSRARIPAAADRHPGRGRTTGGVSSVRARHSTGCPRSNGNQSTPPGHLPGTSPYPAVILSGRLRS